MIDIIKKIDSKNLEDMQSLLKKIKLYKDLVSKLGNRGKALFASIVNNTHIYKVEYYETISEQEALTEALQAYKKVFGEEVKQDEVILKSKKTLDGGIKVFRDDELLDLSFKKIENILK